MFPNKAFIPLILVAGFISTNALAQNSTAGTTEQRTNRTEFRNANRSAVGLGIVMRPNKDGSGINIAAVSPKGPANLAGLQAGDVITAIDGQSVSGQDNESMKQARMALKNLKEGQIVKISYLRANKNAVVLVKASKIDSQMIVNRELYIKNPNGEHTMAHATRWQGLNMAELNPQLGRYFGISSGVLILSSNKGFAGLQAGDVITKIDGNTVTSSRDVLKYLRTKKAGEKINLDIFRDRKALSLSVIVPKQPPMDIPPQPPAPPKPPMPPAPPRTAASMAPPPPPPPPHELAYL